MGAKMRTRPMAKWAAKWAAQGFEISDMSHQSRKGRREYTKSVARKGYQTQTKGAANRARKSVAGKDRHGFAYVDAQYERHLESRGVAMDEPLADWERAALRNAAVISMMP